MRARVIRDVCELGGRIDADVGQTLFLARSFHLGGGGAAGQGARGGRAAINRPRSSTRALSCRYMRLIVTTSIRDVTHHS